MNVIRAVLITREPIVLDEWVRKLTLPQCGAVATFLGVVRDHADGRAVESIEYTAYEGMAEQELATVVRRVAEAHAVAGAVVVHRLGHLAVGEASLGVVVSSAHRREALACTLEIIDELKRTVPIWKRERGPDGTTWV
jgi:molybdopterin synthase catalytic subunit